MDKATKDMLIKLIDVVDCLRYELAANTSASITNFNYIKNQLDGIKVTLDTITEETTYTVENKDYTLEIDCAEIINRIYNGDVENFKKALKKIEVK